MALKSENDDQMSDCEDSDASIELTDDDKNYIEKLMVHKYNKDKLILSCPIWDKIRLSANPESTNTFLDFLFMEHENDFEFTMEKRKKIIQSLVNDYIETESRNEKDKKLQNIKAPGSKIKHENVTRKSLISRSFNRYSAIPVRIRKTTRIIPERKTLLSKIVKVNDTSNCSAVKKEVRPTGHRYKSSMIEKSESQVSQPNKYKTTYHKMKGTNRSPAENEHTLLKNLKNYKTPGKTVLKNLMKRKVTKQTLEENKHALTKNHKNYKILGTKTVLKIEVRPKTVIRNKGPQERQSNKYKDHSFQILGTKRTFVETRHPQTESINCNKTPCNTELKQETKPTSVNRKGDSEGVEDKVFLAPSLPVRKAEFTNRQNCNVVGIELERRALMKDPKNPFYIPDDYINNVLPQQVLASQGWNPTRVLYGICEYRGWGKPEFLAGGNGLVGGYLCCVRVKGYSFMARSRGQTKQIARQLAATRFLGQIGIRFVYKIPGP